MQAGKRVRIRTAPDRIGVLTGEPQVLGSRYKWKVQFPEGIQRVLATNLELVEEDESVEDLIRSGNFGSAENLRMAITHARLTGRLADVIYSMEATNTEFFPYQFKPVLNFLDSPSNGILIADEVGLGKTIEAGLIWTELKARMDANKLLVLCPAVLREKWQQELLHRFGVDAKICNAKELHQILKNNTGMRGRGFAAICSIQGLRPSKDWEEDLTVKTGSAELARYISEASVEGELFDCVIVDEAHYLRNPESQTHKLAQLIRPATKNIVLLSATPVQLRSDDLFHLLNIIDNENFPYKQSFDEVLRANQPILKAVSRIRSGAVGSKELSDLLNECLAHPLLSNSSTLKQLVNKPPSKPQLKDVEFQVRLANRIERINLLGSVINRTRKRDVAENRVIREPSAPLIEMTEVESEFYEAVTQGVRRYCQKYDLFEGFMLTIPQRQMCSSMPAALRSWMRKSDAFNAEEAYEGLGANDDQVVVVNKNISGPLIDFLSGLSGQVATFKELKASDSKYKMLSEIIQDYWVKYPDEKIVLFSFYRETLTYLRERLNEDGVDVALLMGGMGKEKLDVLDEFKDPNGPRLLLTSEVLSEGVDLQFSSVLINYDLPWNPMRVEQRIGRIDRIGQKRKNILIWNFFYANTLDDRIYQRLYSRLDVFQHALGDMEAILGEQIRGLTFKLLTHDLTSKQEEDLIKQTSQAVENVRAQQEELESEAAGLAAHGDFVLKKISAAHEMRRFIDGESLCAYVSGFLDKVYPGCRLIERPGDKLAVDVELSMSAKTDLKHFLDTEKSFAQTRLVHTATGKTTKCIFNNQVDFGSAKYEAINQSHPLVRFVSSNVNVEDIHPIFASRLSSSSAPNLRPGQYVALIKRWSTSGAKTVEKLVYRVIDLEKGKILTSTHSESMIMRAVSQGDRWDSFRGAVDLEGIWQAYVNLETIFDDEFDEYCQEMSNENADRVSFLISSVESQAARQINSRRSAIASLQEKGNTRLIKANEGAIAKIEHNRDQRIRLIENDRQVSSEPSDVITGVIYVD